MTKSGSKKPANDGVKPVPQALPEETATKDKTRRPNRLRHKKQITARLDERLLEMAQVRATKKGCFLTDILEESLFAWMLSDDKGEQPTFQGRLLWQSLPIELQKRTYSFWCFCHFKKDHPSDEAFRRAALAIFDKYFETPEYFANLEKLGVPSPEPPEENGGESVAA